MDKSISFLRVLPVVMAGAVLFSSCFGGKKEGDSSLAGTGDSVENVKKTGALSVDSLRWEDSLLVGENKANICIAGWYPTGGQQPLADSVRAWIAQRLSSNQGVECQSEYGGNAAVLSDGNALLAAVGNALIDSARVDFGEFVDSESSSEFTFSTAYEHMYYFAPVFHSYKVFTYDFFGYDYLGGAHGSSQEIGQTFVVSTGVGLNAANMFQPEKVAQLIQLIREGLWSQYFASSESDEDDASLADVLSVAPELLTLPACAPMCVENGVRFVYQQYEIACYAAGMPQCVLPYEAVKPLMRPEVANLMP